MSNYSKWTSCILLFLVLILCMDFVCAFDDSIGGIGDNINLSLTTAQYDIKI